jgi:N-acetylmuramoyl-L-alanine amidase
VVVALVATAVVLATRGDDAGTAVGSTVAPPSSAAVSTIPTESVTTTVDGTGTGDSGAGATAGATTTIPPATTLSVTTLSVTTTAQPTPTSQSTTTSSTSSTTSATAQQSAGFVVVIDPGHQAEGDYSLEPVGPGSSEQKAKVSSGTAGVVTGTPESELVLAVALKLRESLESHGIQVIMTRTAQDVNISNSRRAQIANDAGADLFVRIHADGNDDAAVNGIHVLYPASIAGWTDDIAVASKRAATLAQQELIAATGAKDRGIDARSDMTGFNWSDVPVILPEIGFMTNAAEDRLLATSAYQDKIVDALTRAILTSLGVS